MPSTNSTFKISAAHLSLSELHRLFHASHDVELSEEARQKVEYCRNYLDQKIEREENPVYGINTGFGSLCNVAIEGKDLKRLQLNLVRSHACGSGERIAPSYVKLMLLLKARGLSYGLSGVSPSTIEQLLFFYNNEIIPEVFEQGSLGASGDLAPLAHLSLALMGEGRVHYQGEYRDSSEVLARFERPAVDLRSKEGIALLNGTQFMLSLGIMASFELRKLAYLADRIAALSLEAFDGRPEPFDDLIHAARPHKGQRDTAAQIRAVLEGSEMISRKKVHVQDPYSFRCIPQVHGASKDALAYAEQVFETELNSVTDNPTIFPDEDKIISGGNFHGQTLALALDHLALATAEWANISERRTYLLISGQRDLPAFLVAKPGLNSGLMIAQYTAASVVSQNKQLCTPASADSIVSSNGQEDHVSMGANAATKLQKVVDNLKTVLAIELMTASQAFYFRQEKTSEELSALLSAFREKVPFIDEDRILHHDIQAARSFIEEFKVESEQIYA
ncbi:histidine ammonia-lyase [Croceimicrobium hydrocarbonivorans]|uniref:Histidine ammonia-lyase n=1 Tax=Croceimicrobium hydrocarbonivorans TaxID=2761580 RepID=A0A7H0VDI9_9FLAO|nr:histidine ammonia-lyase [Croceimicrobium hydrocarbonivorans]QNR23787.1 histidine ammonia-lyase [Croceimicrobium hydrocarbonivorans]